jgi:hypothetical protein
MKILLFIIQTLANLCLFFCIFTIICYINNKANVIIAKEWFKIPVELGAGILSYQIFDKLYIKMIK